MQRRAFAPPHLVAYTRLTCAPQVNGGSVEEKVDFAHKMFEKSVRVDSVFQENEMIDTIAITRGRGTEGVVTRWGVSRLPRKTHRGLRKARARPRVICGDLRLSLLYAVLLALPVRKSLGTASAGAEQANGAEGWGIRALTCWHVASVCELHRSLPSGMHVCCVVTAQLQQESQSFRCCAS